MLDLAKIESGNAEWNSSEIDMREVVEDAVTATSQLFKDKGVALTVQVPDAVPSITADRDRVMQVMLNLLSNAAKFCSPADGMVSVSMLRQGDFLRIEVTDNGAGISEADQEIIFEKFRQVGDTLTQKPEGTGLGLAICRQIIGHFGGRLWVNSGPGEGSTFSFTIPIATVDAYRAPEPRYGT